ncbi:MAG: hypothetical protein QNJ68_06750 [Microcoleaceae cyanobacterium MO_207.B10]|nr:hypothetical protein [Microcoleaceae cyanobacterium MO_207.B10]
MTTFIFALLCYSATSYIFSGSICYVAAKEDININQSDVKEMRSPINLGVIFWWPWWLIGAINKEEKAMNLTRLVEENYTQQHHSSNKYSEKQEVAGPIGQVLYQAGLISGNEVEKILQYQSSNRHLRFGEIAVMWRIIKQETADFFVELFPQLIKDNQKKPLGEYLKLAKLLNDEQIYSILVEQHQTNLRFGEVAVQKGWLKQETIDFVLHYLKGECTSVVES